MGIDFTKGKINRQIWSFTMPMLLGNVFQQFYNLTDSIIVGQVLGKEALAAVGASFPIIFTLISLVIGVGSGFSVVISQYFGARQNKNVVKTVHTMYIFLLIAGIIISALGILFSKEIFLLLKLPNELIEQADIYLKFFLIGLTFSFGFNATSSALRGIGDSRTPLYFLVFSTILNIILDLLFVIVLEMGISGAALATVISLFITFVALLIFLRRKKSLLCISIKKICFDNEIFKKSLKIGLPSGVQMISVSLGMTVILGIVNTFGTDVIAAYTAAGRIDALAVVPAMIFGQTITSFVGQNMGVSNFKRIIRGVKITFFQSAAICILITTVILIFGSQLILLFNTDENVIMIGKKYLIIVSSFYILFAAMFVFLGALRGAGDTIIPMFITIFVLWGIRVPVAYFLSKEMGEEGIWWSLPLAWLLGLILASLYFRKGKWKSKGIVKPNK